MAPFSFEELTPNSYYLKFIHHVFTVISADKEFMGKLTTALNETFERVLKENQKEATNELPELPDGAKYAEPETTEGGT